MKERAAAEPQAEGSAFKAKLEFGIWYRTFQRAYARWSKAPNDLKVPLLLTGTELGRAENWLLANPDKLSEGEKRFIIRSIGQSAGKPTGRSAKRPVFTLKTARSSRGAAPYLFAAVLYGIAVFLFAPDFIKNSLEASINGGLRKDKFGKTAFNRDPKSASPPAPAEPMAVDQRPQQPANVALAIEPGPGPDVVRNLDTPPANLNDNLIAVERHNQDPATLDPTTPPKALAATSRVRQLLELSAGAGKRQDSRQQTLLALEAMQLADAAPASAARDAQVRQAISTLQNALTTHLELSPKPQIPKSRTVAEVATTHFCDGDRGLVAAHGPAAILSWRIDGKNPPLTTTAIEETVAQLRGATVDKGCRRLALAGEDDTAVIVSLGTGKPLSRITGHEAPILVSSFSPDGRWLLTGSQDNTARVWDAQSGRQRAILSGHDDAVLHVAFSPDGRTAITTSADKTARLWDAASGRQLRVLDDHHGKVTQGEFSPDGKLLLTTSWDGYARIWDLTSAQPARRLHSQRTNITSARFSKDGSRVATIFKGEGAQIWSAATGTPIFELSGPGGEVRSIAFSANDQWIATTSQTGVAVLYAGSSGRLISTLNHAGEPVGATAFSADARTMSALTAGGTIVGWPLFDSGAGALRSNAGLARNCLSLQERDKLGLGPDIPQWCEGGAESSLETTQAGDVARPRTNSTRPVPSD